jgi:hypothetical protein
MYGIWSYLSTLFLKLGSASGSGPASGWQVESGSASTWCVHNTGLNEISYLKDRWAPARRSCTAKPQSVLNHHCLLAHRRCVQNNVCKKMRQYFLTGSMTILKMKKGCSYTKDGSLQERIHLRYRVTINRLLGEEDVTWIGCEAGISGAWVHSSSSKRQN